MPRDQESLIDIATAIKRILRYTANISRATLETAKTGAERAISADE